MVLIVGRSAVGRRVVVAREVEPVAIVTGERPVGWYRVLWQPNGRPVEGCLML
jgi:hypothetical protein